MHPFRAMLPALVLAPLLVGCGEAYWTGNVRETRGFPANSMLLTNADIRAVSRVEGFGLSREVLRDAKDQPVMRRGKDGQDVPIYVTVTRPRQIVCAEPSPDVARVVQAALSAGASASVDITSPVGPGLAGPDIAKGIGAARLDASRSEAVAQLTRRIATVQLLRDGMYRACEAYANGAIGQEIYTAIVSRYDRMMITMLLGEMASGNLPGLSGAGGSASAGALPEVAAALSAKVDEAKKTLASAEATQKAALDTEAEKRKAVAEKQAELRTAKEADLPDARTALKTAEDDRDAATKKLAIDKAATERARVDLAEAQQAQRLSGGRAGTVANASPGAAPVANPAADIAEVLYRMQRAYLNDPQLGTQVLICASEAAQQDPLQPYQRGMCKAVMDAAFPVDGGRPSLDRSRDLQMAELRNQSIVKVLTALPANTTPAQRNELARILRDLLN